MTQQVTRKPSGIRIDVEGESVDLADVTWTHIAPCGCTSGAIVAYSDYGPAPARVLPTAEAAASEFGGSTAERKQDEGRGFTWRAIRFSDLPDMTCPHDPKWGYDKPPKPESMTWAVGGFWKERTRVLHLINEESAETNDAKVERDKWEATSLCGVKKSHWDRRWHVMDGKVECARCQRKASALIAVAAEAVRS